MASEWAKVEEDCRTAIQLDSKSVKVSGCLDLSFIKLIPLCILFPSDYEHIPNYRESTLCILYTLFSHKERNFNDQNFSLTKHVI